MRGIILVLCWVLTILACNMEAGDTPPSPTATPQDALPTWEVDAATLAACQPRTDWVVYTVQRRDSLTTIANAIGSTVDELAEGNCLQNRNRIITGQTLLVPRLPGDNAAPTTCDTTLYDPQLAINTVQITPTLNFANACYVLAADVPVVISWDEADASTVEVTFYRYSQQLSRPDVIGVDNTPADGFFIRWIPPPEMPPSIIYAIASGGNREPDPVGVVIGQ
ncbi:MAG: hypothetical protein CUN56_01680 [Phototrophicales bacterium]|nr:MAG: hypothetical protein CUN56_01680 [Phototrophicales bacterium]RMG74952.1 MAG: LysM peptidoglycan-binding domain-containing protein [Chloroflexota bacterium]